MGFTLAVIAGLLLFGVPAFIIQPFKHQSPGALSLALTLRQLAPWGTLAAVIAALVFFVKLWPRSDWWKRTGLVLGLCLASAAAVMAHVDYFEWMFHPIAGVEFQSVENVKLDSGEMIMAVRFGDDARAYPIRAMAYHHVLNDVVNGIPITVTY